MAIELERRPYAATANVMAVLARARSRNLPEAIGSEFYRLAGIGEAVFGRVTDALIFLGLINPEGAPTDTLRSMASAPEADFRELLAGTVRDAYGDVFARGVDPAEDTQAQIRDAFRRYQPKSQTDRMVMLFLGLCREGGIPVKDVPRDRKMANPSNVRAKVPFKTKTQRDSSAPVESVGKSAQSEVAGKGVLFGGVTESDLAALPEEEFDEFWAALGTVARRVAKLRALPERPEAPRIAEQPEEEGG